VAQQGCLHYDSVGGKINNNSKENGMDIRLSDSLKGGCLYLFMLAAGLCAVSAHADEVKSGVSKRITDYTITVFQETSATPEESPTVTVSVPSGYKVIGGGAKVNWQGYGNLLTASYPSSATSWTAAGKSAVESSPATITAYAVAIHDPNDDWEVTITESTSQQAAHPYAAVAPAAGYALTGGGAKTNFSGAGSFLTASYPHFEATSGFYWYVNGKDHIHSDPATITAYAIGIKGAWPDVQTPAISVYESTSPVAQHPSVTVTLPITYSGVVTTGGAIDNWTGWGNMLTAIYPTGDKTWVASGKDQAQGSPADIDGYLLIAQ
jgi:hypothetical protein